MVASASSRRELEIVTEIAGSELSSEERSGCALDAQVPGARGIMYSCLRNAFVLRVRNALSNEKKRKTCAHSLEQMSCEHLHSSESEHWPYGKRAQMWSERQCASEQPSAELNSGHGLGWQARMNSAT